MMVDQLDGLEAAVEISIAERDNVRFLTEPSSPEDPAGYLRVVTGVSLNETEMTMRNASTMSDDELMAIVRVERMDR